jgi:RNA polymerase primary sigma factor
MLMVTSNTHKPTVLDPIAPELVPDQTEADTDADLDVAFEPDPGLDEDRPLPKPDRRLSTTDNALGMYFRDIATDDLLGPEEELQIARDIEQREIEVWVDILTFPQVLDHVLKVLESCLDNSLSEFRALRRAADAARRTRTRATRHKLVTCARATAPKLRALDLDKTLLTVMLGELRALATHGTGRVVRTRPKFKPDSRVFQEFTARVERSATRAAEARNAFVRANLRLVVSIARRYSNGPMALADLIQEGNLGLIKAVDRFDHRRGFRFSTYASWWIRHSVGRALADKGREVRVPVHMIDANYRISKAKRQLRSSLGRKPTRDEVAAAANIPANKLEQMSTLLVGHPVSFDQPVAQDDQRSLLDVFEDPAEEESSTVDRMTRDSLQQQLRELMHTLSPIEVDILRRRFGLEGESEQTLQEIADSYDRSRERIRQIQSQALDKLRRGLKRNEMV